MVAQYLKHGGVWKSLFVIAEQLGNIDASENCGLARSALRPSFNSETCVCRHDCALKYCPLVVNFCRVFVRTVCRLLVRKYRQRLRTRQASKRILRTTCADPQTVNEEEQN